MSKYFLKGVVVLIAACFLASCTMRTYVQDRSRVDQEMGGNAGCIQGACPEVDRGDVKETRKTYVLEIIKNPKPLSEGEITASQKTYTQDFSYTPAEAAPTPPRVVEPVVTSFEDQTVAFVDYKIMEGDTLQKISKKFYGTYSRWNEIYEANADVLKSPDRIKPGKIIRIPQK